MMYALNHLQYKSTIHIEIITNIYLMINSNAIKSITYYIIWV